MNSRPILHGLVNSGDKCSCGNKKSLYRQWCDTCWNKIPIKVAKNMVTRSLALARTINTCETHIKEYDERLKREPTHAYRKQPKGDSSLKQDSQSYDIKGN